MLANSNVQKLYAQFHNDCAGSYKNIKSLERSTFVTRLRIVNFLALLMLSLVISRIIFINVFNNDFLSMQLNSRILRTIKITATRGAIKDRYGNPLAVSTPVSSIWVDPSALNNLTNKEIQNIASILGLTVNEVNKKLNKKDKTFVYLKRTVNPYQAELIKNLGITGISTIQEFKRYYPSGEVSAHVVGFTNIDDQGGEGIEYADNKELVGHNGTQQILRDRQGHVVDDLGDKIPPENGKDVILSIDSRIQDIAYNALKNQVNKFNAKGGSAVVLDAKTGEVLAMVNMPTYNPNNRKNVTANMIRNSSAIDLYEPGSTMKPFVVAKALDLGLVNPNTVFDTHPMKVGPKTFHDDHPYPSLSVSGILEHSSDIGAAKISMKMSPQTMWEFDKQLGFGNKIGTGFPGEASGYLIPWKKWHPIDQATMAFGYAISVSLLQMARGYSLFTNNGCMLPISFYKINEINSNCNQIIKPNIALQMRNILARITTDGTGKNAKVNGYTSAGKTGTAHKATKHGYSPNHYIGSYIGYAPAKNPRIIVAVMIDDATKGSYYGATVAAPVFGQIAEPTLHLLGIKPDNL